MDEFIKKYRSEFDSLEPASDHEAAFEKRLISVKKRFINIELLRYAAMLILVFAAGSAVTFFLNNEKQSDTKLTEEIYELETYYNIQTVDFQNTITTSKIEEQDKTELLNELKMMDSLRNSLITDFGSSGNDSRVKNAMISYYERKLRGISYILENLKRVNNPKNNEYEKVSL